LETIWNATLAENAPVQVTTHLRRPSDEGVTVFSTQNYAIRSTFDRIAWVDESHDISP
jgi:hypothetical protein